MYKIKNLVLIVLLVFVANFSFAQQHIDDALSRCISERYHDLDNNPINEMTVFRSFEKKLIDKGWLRSKSQESYAELMTNLLNDDVRVAVSQMREELDILSMPSNLATTMLCFNDVYVTQKSIKTSSVGGMNPFIEEIIYDFNIGDKFINVELIRSINIADFSKMIYKTPILVLIHNIAYYKEEMQQIYSAPTSSNEDVLVRVQ